MKSKEEQERQTEKYKHIKNKRGKVNCENKNYREKYIFYGMFVYFYRTYIVVVVYRRKKKIEKI